MWAGKWNVITNGHSRHSYVMCTLKSVLIWSIQCLQPPCFLLLTHKKYPSNFHHLSCYRMKAMVEVPRRPTMQEIQARRNSSVTENRLNKRLGMSLPNLGDDQTISFQRNTLLSRVIMSDPGKGQMLINWLIDFYNHTYTNKKLTKELGKVKNILSNSHSSSALFLLLISRSLFVSQHWECLLSL